MTIFPVESSRKLRETSLAADLVVVGGGLAGVCCSIVAAREGMRVVLVQDRPVLGGNASSEVRLWALGATSHLGNNNRWSREGGVIDEILVENLYRNPEGNPHLFDALLQDKILAEPNITLLLDTAVFEIAKGDDRNVESVTAFSPQNGTVYRLSAPQFCDASGDGIVAYLAGASFRLGAEEADEFDEAFAPDESFGELLGHSMFFYSRDTGRPVRFIPPDFALKDISEIPRFRDFTAGDTGCKLWWIEYGGRLDTVHDTRQIKHELQRVIYGVWNHIKNSGQFPEAENLTLEWVGHVPGKRESRRFIGDYMISQRDVIEQRDFDDAIAFGGWAIDLHPGDGIYSELDGCTQWHSKGVYQIPYRTMYSRDLDNLFLAGRIISATHVALGSLRVMATTAHSAQAVGMAAALCRETGALPRQLAAGEPLCELQRRLLRIGHYIPRLELDDPLDLATQATAEATSTLRLEKLEADAEPVPLEVPRAMLVPCRAGKLPEFTFSLAAEGAAEMEFQLRISGRLGNFTPDVTLETQRLPVEAGPRVSVRVQFETELTADQYAFVCLMPAAGVAVHTSDQRVTGVLAVSHGRNLAVAKSPVQTPPPGIGIDGFEFWLPGRRPAGRNLALAISPPIALFEPAEVLRGPQRPTTRPNAWVADPADPDPRLTLRWPEPVNLRRVTLFFDTDFDHPMESVQMGHPEREIPFCVRDFDLLDDQDRVLHSVRDNHQTRCPIRFPKTITTSRLTVRVLATHGAPVAVFRIQCFGTDGTGA